MNKLLTYLFLGLVSATVLVGCKKEDTSVTAPPISGSRTNMPSTNAPAANT